MEEEIKYTLKYKLSEEDYYLFSYWHYKILFIYKAIRNYIILFLLIYLPNESDLVFSKKAGLILFITFLVYMIYFSEKGTHKNIANLVFKQDKSMQRERTIQFYETQMVVIDDNSNERYEWMDFYKVIKTKKYIYIMISLIKGIIIPLKVIENPELIEFINKKSEELKEKNKNKK